MPSVIATVKTAVVRRTRHDRAARQNEAHGNRCQYSFDAAPLVVFGMTMRYPAHDKCQARGRQDHGQGCNGKACGSGHMPAQDADENDIRTRRDLGDANEIDKGPIVHPMQMIDDLAMDFRHGGIGAADGNQRNASEKPGDVEQER